ncbi:lipase, partial [Vibrio vulnificus]
LIMHSRDDDFVPYGPSKELARRNPEMVTFVEFSQAGHTREWNVDAARWEAVVTAWLVPRLGRYELPRDTVPEEYRD